MKPTFQKPFDTRRFEQRLHDRREALRAELIATQRDGDLEHAGQRHDRGDESVAELLIGVDILGRERELEELKDVETALTCIKQGTFGICVDCGNDIGSERLEIYPIAKRCIACQRRHEQNRSGGKDATPSL